MKLIEAMKKIKDLQIKADDLKFKVSVYHAHMNYENPMYGANQKNKIDEWLQGYSDILREILRLRLSIQKTNLQTNVTIELGDKQIIKTITEWIHRRKDLAKLDMAIWQVLTDKGLKDGIMKNSEGQPQEIKVVRYYDPVQRDNKVELYRSEPSKIDATLEITNAVTDLIE